VNGVRLVASAFGLIAWIILIGGGLALLLMGSAISSMLRSPAGMLTVLPGMLAVAVASLTPFFLWAVLTALCELHDQGQRVLTALDRLDHRAVVGQSAGSPTVLPANVATPTPADAARPPHGQAALE
jgi:hypothetical protein